MKQLFNRFRKRLAAPALGGFALVLLAILPGCERPPGASQAAHGRPPAGLSPRATLERLLELRARNDYNAMAELIVPERRHETVTTLIAVDDFLAANRELTAYVRQHVSPGAALAIDSSSWAANLDIFSRYVEFRGEREPHGAPPEAGGTTDGARATAMEAEVDFQIDRRLPLKTARLRDIDGIWRYDPGPGYQPELPAAFHKLARGLRNVLDDLRSGRLDPVECVSRPEKLVEEVRLRLSPGIRTLPGGGAATRTDAATGAEPRSPDSRPASDGR